jgi:glycosyltransferase involved in cell wall biosynthesis
LKIVVFIENIQHGGLDTFCVTLLKNWPSKDDRFVIVCNKSHPGKEYLRSILSNDCKFIFHRIPLSWCVSKALFGWLPTKIRRLTQPLIRILIMQFQVKFLRILFKRIRGDALIVLNGGFPGGETCRLANIAWVDVNDEIVSKRNIHNFHNFAAKPRFGFGWFENRIDSRLSKAASHIVSVSQSCADSLRTRPVFYNYEKTHVIYNGVLLHQLVTSENLPDLRYELAIHDAPLCIVLANYEERKGHRFLFKVFAEVAKYLPAAHLVCCGDNLKGRMKAVIACRELAPTANIHLLDFIPGGQQLISQADVVLIGSQSFESFGLTAVEAMIRGVPVIATRVGGLPEVIGEDEGVGYLIDSNDVIGFSEKIIQLLTDSKLRSGLGELGKARAENIFSPQQMSIMYRNLLSFDFK